MYESNFPMYVYIQDNWLSPQCLFSHSLLTAHFILDFNMPRPTLNFLVSLYPEVNNKVKHKLGKSSGYPLSLTRLDVRDIAAILEPENLITKITC